jgi:hypothetical protein
MSEKRKVGRPTDYRDEHCQTVIECGAQGYSLMEMCFTVCRSYETFQNWQKLHPEFSKAVKTAKSLSQAWWERKGREATFGEVDGFNATSYIFQMKNRFREDWRDRHELTGADGGPVAFVLRDMTKTSD